MQQLSQKKKLQVVRLYLEGLAYNDIAAKAIVAKGTAVNVISELKAGRFPEAADLGDQLEVLRELAIGIKQSNMTFGQAAIGMTMFTQLQKANIEPADITRCVELANVLEEQHNGFKAFIDATSKIEETRKRTGLSVEELEKRVLSLEEKANRLAPAAKQLQDFQKELAVLDKQRQQLTDTASELEKRRKFMTEEVKHREEREAELSNRVAELEEKAHAANERLARARKDTESLAGLGISLGDLSGFVGEIKNIAHRHGIDPDSLRKRLFGELKLLDKGLGLEAVTKAKRSELKTLEKATEEARRAQQTLETSNQQLRQEKAILHTEIADQRKHVIEELGCIHTMAKNAIIQFNLDMKEGIGQSVNEVVELRDLALQLGKEAGHLEEMIENNAWFKNLVSLFNSEEKADLHQARVISLRLLRGVLNLLGHASKNGISTYTLKISLENTVVELEKWKP